MSASDLETIAQQVESFARARDWEQFHTPKNLAMALSVEVGELLEHFVWLTPEESSAVMRDPDLADSIRDELADVLIYLVSLADVLNVDLGAAVSSKLKKNEIRYPVSRAKGSAAKYTEWSGDSA